MAKSLKGESPLELAERLLEQKQAGLTRWNENHDERNGVWEAEVADAEATLALRQAGDDKTIVRTAVEAWLADQSAERVEQADWDPQAVKEVADGLGRKFEVADVTDDLYDYGVAWLKARPTPISFEYLRDLREQLDGGKDLSVAQVKGVLNCVVADARRARPHATPPAAPQAAPQAGVAERAEVAALSPGIYKLDDAIFKVQAALHGSQHLYAKRLVLGAEGAKARFEYEQGAIRKLTPADRLDLEQAKAFGAVYGVCCVCGALLTNEDSIEAGIGPICAGKL